MYRRKVARSFLDGVQLFSVRPSQASVDTPILILNQPSASAMYSCLVTFAFLTYLSAVLGISPYTHSTSTGHNQVGSNGGHLSGERSKEWSMYGSGGNERSSTFPFSRAQRGKKKIGASPLGKGSKK
ncbi:hypothetical protein PCANC_16344 [Puccinia coronata f. sp. avenae]|uniref:Uncharacterized protein n=1 Tax=Puccinia coronata f. sp. avenae TaxID=200324 RepID=A0A2N5S6R5_9BASI|nr:hypothetical protein PCASD_22157 [Puccinia coronata f. sp. avenae]PLW14279.1 hypothetical protein PCANC_19746 [Puccinia coronata f. sp. avenae]PLW40084.1 hypothetical protein PCANC_16344 [Puccinia coronata f. sp. avenae]PLW46653.1 hypothetical protein PCASD_03705 [Puccinia coronata f. sp. avenae]